MDLYDVDEHVRLACALEVAGVDFVLIPDGWANPSTGEEDAGLRSILWAVPIALETRRIGIVTSMRTTFMAPMHVARFGSHLDWLSGGRWSWCVVPGGDRVQAQLYGRDLPDLETRYRMAADSVDAVRAIWDGAERGVDHHGPYFQVSGRSKRPFLTQRVHPPLFGAGSSSFAIALAGSHLDIWITGDDDSARLRTARDELAASAAPHDRSAPRLFLKASFGPVPDRPDLPPSGTSAMLSSTPQEAADSILERYATGMIDGVLLDIPTWSEDDLERVAQLVTALAQRRMLESSAARTARW